VRNGRGARRDLRRQERGDAGGIVREGVCRKSDDVDCRLVRRGAEDAAWRRGRELVLETRRVEVHAAVRWGADVGGGAGEGAADEAGGLDGRGCCEGVVVA
jgi:hypothetical protein